MAGVHSRRRSHLRWLGLVAVASLVVLYPFHVYVDHVVTVNVSFGDLVIGAVGLLWLVGVVGVRRLPRFTVPVAAFASVALVSIAVALATGASFLVREHSAAEFVKLLGAVAWFVGTFALCANDAVRRTRALALVSVVVATLLAARTIHTGLVVGELRPTGPFENPNIYANYLVLNGFLAAYVGDSLLRERGLVGLLPTLTIPTFAAALVVTASRGSLVGAVAGLLAIPVLHPRTSVRAFVRPVLLVPLSLTVGAAYAVLQSDQWIRDRLVESVGADGKNVDTRLRRWGHGIDAFRENPVTGVGYGQSQNYVREAGFGGVYPRLHNTHLTIASETGVLGLLAFYGLIAAVVLQSVRLARERDPAVAFLGSFFVALLGEGLVTDVATFRSLWLVAGMIAALSYYHLGDGVAVRDVPDRVAERIAAVRGSIQRLGTS